MPPKLILTHSRRPLAMEVGPESDSDEEFESGSSASVESLPVAWQRSIQRAEKGSLSRLLFPRSAKSRKKGPKNLYVHPVMWSAEHLEILQCPPPLRTLPSAAAPSSSPGIPQFSTRIPFDYYLTNMHCVVSQDPNLIHRQIGLRQVVNSIIEDRKKKVADLREVIVTRESFPNWPCLVFFKYWGPDKADKLTLQLGVYLICWEKFRNAAKKKTQYPVFAYIDKVDNAWLQAEREKLLQFRQLRCVLKNIRDKPPPAIDPYYVAVMIAMAQMMYKRGLGGVDADTNPALTFQVHLLCPSDDICSLIRYSADITPRFLRKFDEPFKFHDARLEITQTEVPFNDLEKMGNIIEEILLHNVPMQYHLPTPSLARYTTTLQMKRKVLGSLSPQATTSLALNVADMHISKRLMVDENEDTIMSGTETADH